jgi:cytochrome c oxidase subunit 2
MALAVVLILLVIGSLLFHFLSPWWFTPIASNWGMMDTTVDITFWVTGTVFVAVNLFLAYAVMRFRHRKGQRAKYEPENKKLEMWLTIVTAIGVAAMLTPGLFVWAQFVDVPEDAAVVEVKGQQWTWSYRFPGRDGELGESAATLITPENPFGIDAVDPRGRDDVLVSSPQLHLPVNRPVKLLLRSSDVLHNFTVPEFRVKMDLVPGMVTYMWLTPTRTGSFDVLCEELCGLAHFAMRGRVVVDEQEVFDRWLAAQPTFAGAMAAASADPEAGRTAYAACVACHGAEGEGNVVLNAPRLAGQDAWYIVRQLQNFRDGVRGVHEGDVFGSQMIAFASLLDAAATANVAAYLQAMPSGRTAATVAGDAARGADLYTTCAGCHGVGGQGIWTTKAPRLADMSDWYLARQIRNFRSGVRGSHDRDYYGAQMASMARILIDDRAPDDLAAYVNTLRPAGQLTASNRP